MNNINHSSPQLSVQLLINNKWVDAADSRTIPIQNPATGDVVGRVAHAGRGDLDLALAASATGFETWRRIQAFDRCKIMRRAAELLRERKDDIGLVMTIEQGKPLEQSVGEVLASADAIEWFAEEGRRSYGKIVPARSSTVRQLAFKEPVGPVAAFTPWNFPVLQAVRKISAALATGCSIIVKGPEETPASPALLLQAFLDAGLPDGVAQLVYGTPSEISTYLISHPIIKKVSFTGSTAIGKQLASLAGLHMKRVTMELGGHAPVVVLKDADLDLAVSVTAAGKYRNAGQVCIAPTRFLIEEEVFEEFCTRFTEIAKSVKVGDGLDPTTKMGPLANHRRVEAMEAFVQDAVQNGAELVTGGKRIANSGNFFEPTVLKNVTTRVRAMNEEPFGPLALMVSMKGVDDIVAEANRLNYGLAAYGYTRSASNAAKLGEINSGMVSINHQGLALPELYFGGVNDSGYGSEGGSEALESYLNTKLITHNQVA